MRQNLEQGNLPYPLVFLAPEFRDFGRKWWQTKTKELHREFGMEVVAKSVLNVTFFPYVSRGFGHQKLRVPSQEYNFYLVRQAIARGAVIIHFRRDDIWLDAIPELNRYQLRLKVKNTQNPHITVGSLGEGFKKVRAAIAAAATAGS